MNCILVDDEPLARDVLETYIAQIPSLHLVKSCKNAFEAASVLQQETIDLILLDIQMPDISGIHFLKTLERPPLVIFTTAYETYALQGFEVNAVDYLLKPISPERFLKAIHKAQRLLDLQHSPAIPDSNPTFMFVKSDYQSIKVNFDDILYVEGLKDYVKIHTHKQMIVTLMNMKTLMEKLPQQNFIRIHKSYIVSIAAIEKIDRSRVILGNTWIPIGDSYKEDFLIRMNVGK